MEFLLVFSLYRFILTGILIWDDGDPILKWLERSGADPKETIYIGDTTYDMECAQAAGVDFGLAVWGCRNHAEIQCLRRLERPQEILALLEEDEEA
ncbi:HAD hydrolase-like protein [Paenibacillus albicereus]|uniref:HAD hydrolase-like protein n=1 Tax=Paenibacillus albicereus TaxID=2726185 RepID=A0A6H2GVE9_9BACL|nr:HAD hydrolase-like protein [Paenibacillus albicereus]QJC51390.1 HAD hydrolase-like protein [Paenibacillus albicereus]